MRVAFTTAFPTFQPLPSAWQPPILPQPGRPASWPELTLSNVGEDLCQGGSDAGVVGQQRQCPHRHLSREGAHQAPPRPLVLAVAEIDCQLIRQLLADAAGQPPQKQVQLAGLPTLLSGLALQGLARGRRAQQGHGEGGWSAGASSRSSPGLPCLHRTTACDKTSPTQALFPPECHHSPNPACCQPSARPWGQHCRHLPLPLPPRRPRLMPPPPPP